MVQKLSAPVSIQWEVTSECNYDCVHCYNHWREGTKKAEIETKMTVEFYRKSVAEILHNGIFAITVTGGEPLLVISTVLPFLDQLCAAGVEVHLNSNLSLLTAEMAQNLKKTGIRSILTSLPSGVKETNDRITQRGNSREKTTRGIKIALEAGLKVSVNMTVSKINLAEIFETARYVKELGICSFSATKAAVPGNCQDFSPYQLSRNEFRFMLSELVRVKEELGLKVDSLEFYPTCSFGDDVTRRLFGSTRSCTAGKTSCTIGFNGEIRPCSHAPFTYGNIFDGLATAWEAMHEWRGGQWIPVECQPCILKHRCGGGCKVEAFLSGGSFQTPDPYCDFTSIPAKPVQKPVFPIDTNHNYKVRQDILFRKENFGGIVFAGNSSWLTVMGDLFSFLETHRGEIINTKDNGVVFGQNDIEVAQTLGKLLSKKIIQKVED